MSVDCYSQTIESYPARLLSDISDGSSAPKTPAKPLPNYDILTSHVSYVNGQKFIVNRIQSPTIQPEREPTATELADRETREIAQRAITKSMKPSGGMFMIYAIIYDRKASLLDFTHKGKRYLVWSNLSWDELSGFATFEGRGKRYDMMLLPLNESTVRLRREKKLGSDVTVPVIPRLPNLETEGPAYMVMEGDEMDEETMEFLEAAHDLYAAEKTRLKAAYQKRLVNRRIQAHKDAALRKNPPPKPDVTIHFWKRDVDKERRESTGRKH